MGSNYARRAVVLLAGLTALPALLVGAPPLIAVGAAFGRKTYAENLWGWYTWVYQLWDSLHG